MPAGRPSEYNDEIASEICALLASGVPLSKICRREEMPSLQTVYNWQSKHPEFVERYARARLDQADTLADEIIDIADDGRNDTYTDGDGNVRVDNEVVQRSRLRVDARKWYASKVAPKKYGDRVENAHTDGNGNPPKFILEAPWMAKSVADRNG